MGARVCVAGSIRVATKLCVHLSGRPLRGPPPKGMGPGKCQRREFRELKCYLRPRTRFVAFFLSSDREIISRLIAIVLTTREVLWHLFRDVHNDGIIQRLH